MASKASMIYLGFLDEQVNSKNVKHLSYTTSKVGGQPNWCVSSCETPLCVECKRKMPLVVQLYAPLENSSYHRTLYIFACIMPQCWNTSNGWVCLRSQILDTKSMLSSNNCNTATDEFWMEEDDWDSMENEDDGNGNPCPSTQILMNYMSSTADNSLYYHENKSENYVCEMNVNENLSKKQTSHTIGEVTECFKNQMSINTEDRNANEEAGATAVQEGGCMGLEASALIEGPEGDMVAVETPEKPSSDLSVLFKQQMSHNLIGDKEICFMSYFISVELEPPESTKFTEHERDLFFQYTQISGHNLQEQDFMKTSGNSGDAIYEKSSASHGDSLLHKFKKRIMRSPQQIIRYCRDEMSDPLWMRPSEDILMNKSCRNCGGRLVFEAQIMPQLVPFLKPQDASNSTILEFGTVALYTCFSSCWKEGLIVQPEFCVVQAEP